MARTIIDMVTVEIQINALTSVRKDSIPVWIL
jgi:hypothetical protein